MAGVQGSPSRCRWRRPLQESSAADAADRVSLFRRRYVCTCLNTGLCSIASLPCSMQDFLDGGTLVFRVEHCRLGVHLTRMCPCSKHYDELEEELDDDMKRRTMHLSSADVTPDLLRPAQRTSIRHLGGR